MCDLAKLTESNRCGNDKDTFLKKWPEALQGTTTLLEAFAARGDMAKKRKKRVQDEL